MFVVYKNCLIFATANRESNMLSSKTLIRAHSSVGSEHLVYTEGVGGSNPSAPTSIRIPIQKYIGIFYFQNVEKNFHKFWK